MRLTDGDLEHLFCFGMAMQRLDERDGAPWHGIAKPHAENPDWIDLWITDEMNTVLPRDVEPDDLGGYTFTDPSGGRRRIFPLPEAQRVSFGSSGDAFTCNDPMPVGGVTEHLVVDALAVRPPEDGRPAPEMAYFLVHYAPNDYPWGVWRSPTESFYGDEAHPSAVERGAEIMARRDEKLDWLEWIDFLTWSPPQTDDRWDMFKSTEPEQLDELLGRLRGGKTYAEWVQGRSAD